MKTFLVIVMAAVSSILIFLGNIQGEHCGRAFTHSSYVAPYVAPVQSYHYVAPKVIQVPVNQDYYYSVNDYYRDKLLVDALAGRVAELQASKDGEAAKYRELLEMVLKIQTGQPGNVVPQPAAPQAKSTAAHPELAAYVSAACLKCHGDQKPKGGLSLVDMDAMSEGARWKMYALVNSGEMPQGGQPAPDGVMKHFYDFAKSAK